MTVNRATFAANIRAAIARRQIVDIGGGHFDANDMRDLLAIVTGEPRRRHLAVDGREYDSPDSPYDGAGTFPPFRVFDADAQDWLAGEYPTRADADRAMAAILEGK